MSEKVQQVQGGGIGFGGLLAVLFIGLKLTGYITWSWWWILVPLWGPIALIFAFLALFCLFTLVVWAFK